MDFSYANFPTQPDRAFPARRRLRRPILGILLRNGEKSYTTMAIVDSGADFCVFPTKVAEQLGIDIPNDHDTIFTGTADTSQVAYFATVQATIWNANVDEAPIEFDLYAGFCDTLDHVGMGLLGQEGFFSRFEISFNFTGNSLTII
jgi:hypothetical protein